MHSPLLQSKLFAPTLRHKLVSRSRLLKQLDSYAGKKLVLVTSPAGFGKTTLVTSWLDSQEEKVIWISLDKNDNAIPLYISLVIEAFQQAEKSIGATAAAILESTDAPNMSIVLLHLINDLSSLETNHRLIFDDYHEIHNEEIHQALDLLIEHTPATLQIMLISRHSPDLSISRLRAQNEIAEISENDLRFDLAETNRFFTDVMQLRLSEKELEVINRQTEGWVAGMQLAALGLDAQTDRSQYIQELSGEQNLIASYLVDEVLANQSEWIQRFLIDTSFLNRFSASLCNAVLQIEGAWDILQFMERRNLFIIPLDDKNDWFRYHHLFSEMLRGRLKQKSSDETRALYNRAVEWHVNQGQLDEAIDYALEGELYERAVELMVIAYEHLHTGLQLTRLQNYLRRIPLSDVRRSDDLWLQYNLTQFYFGSFEFALRFLQSSQEASATEKTLSPTISGMVKILRATVLLHTTLDAHRAQELLHEGLALAPDGPPLIRGIASGHLGSSSLLLGDTTAAERYATDALQLVTKATNWPVRYVFLNVQAEALAAQGNLHQAVKDFEHIHQNAKNRGIHNAIYAGNLLNLGLLHYEWNQMEEAERYIRTGYLITTTHTSIDRMLQAAYALLKLQLAQGTVPSIEESIRQIEAEAAKFDYPLLVMDRIDALQSLCALVGGDKKRAERWAHTYAQRNKHEITCLRQHDWLVVAQIWMETNRLPEAINVLETLLDLAAQDRRIWDWITLCVLLTRATYLNGDAEQAETILSNALTTAEPEDLIRSFLDGGELIQALLTKFQRDKSHAHYQSPYIRKILLAANQGESNQVPQALTPRELEIIHLLARGLRYSQIAEQLTITENTLKFHIKNIYGKLDVQNRTQAVLLAKERDLL